MYFFANIKATSTFLFLSIWNHFEKINSFQDRWATSFPLKALRSSSSINSFSPYLTLCFKTWRFSLYTSLSRYILSSKCSDLPILLIFNVFWFSFQCININGNIKSITHKKKKKQNSRDAAVSNSEDRFLLLHRSRQEEMWTASCPPMRYNLNSPFLYK